MAFDYFLGGAGTDIETNGNWSLGAEPVDTNDVVVAQSDQSLSGATLDQRSVADIDPNSVYIGGTYTGSIGSAAQPWKMDDVATQWEVDVNGANPDQIICIDFDSSPRGIVRNTSSNPYGLYIVDGACTTLYITGGKGVRLGAGFTATTVYVMSEPGREPPHVVIEQGCAITTLDISAGLVKSYAALGTVVIRGTGRLEQLGEAAGNITALTVGGNGYAKLAGGAAGVAYTVTAAITVDNGIIDSKNGPGCNNRWTLTDATARGGAILSKVGDVFTNTPIEAGGVIPHAATKTIIVSPSGMGGGVSLGGK